MTVAHQPLAAFIGALLGVAPEERGHLGLDRLAKRERAPLRSTSVTGSENVDGSESFKTLLSVTAYHSFAGEVEAQSPPRYAALTLHAVTNFWP